MTSSGSFKKATHLVVDSAAFLRPCRIEDFGEKIYTVQAVVDEIRDKDSRQRLSVLPYELIFKEPDSESIKIITDFSKKTGDFPVLSAVDIRLLALAHTLHREHVGVENLRTEPVRTVQITRKPEPISAQNLPGFYKPKRAGKKSQPRSSPSCDQVNREDRGKPEGERREEEHRGGEGGHVEERPEEEAEEVEEVIEEVLEEEEEEAESEEEEEDDDDGSGWITPSNIKKLTSRDDGEVGAAGGGRNVAAVACLTTDFAMQNVLRQMNLVAMGVDGVVIRQIRTYLLRCFACFKTTSDMSRRFCAHCGNKTLKRVGVTVLPDGSRRLHISRRPLNLRGLKFSLPLPKSGKHAHNPVVAEGQREPQQKPSKKSLQKLNALDPEYVARDSPFAVNDVYSRAAQRGYVTKGGVRTAHFDKRNPNESHNTSRRRKKLSGF